MVLVDEVACERDFVVEERPRNGFALLQPAHGERDGVQVGLNQLVLSGENLEYFQASSSVFATGGRDRNQSSLNAKSWSSAVASKSSVTE